MVAGGLSGEEPDEDRLETVSEANSEDVQGWGGAIGSDVCDDGFLPKMKRGLLGDRNC